MMIRTMSPSLLLLASCLLSITAQTQVDPLNPYDNPQIGATLQHYDVDRTDTAISKFTCADGGARCVFRRNNYLSVSFGTGQESQVEGEGATWAAVNDGAVLTLGACTVDDFDSTSSGASCIVSCNANCTCAVTVDSDSDPEPCEQVATRAPTPAPGTDPPLHTQCPKRQFNTFCPELMNTGLPLGLDNEYECFNFCGGYFVSSCDLEGNCGDVECSNKTATGTLNGQVLGCTLEDKFKYSPNTQNGSSGAAVYNYRGVTGLAALLVIAATIVW